MKIEIRKARAEDWPQVAETFIAARAAMLYLPDLHTRDETRAFIRNVTQTQDVWVADGVVDGKSHVAGFAAIHRNRLDHLYIDPVAQNHGIGLSLLTLVKTQRPQGFSLWTFQQNIAARRFYERHGLVLARLTDGRDNEEKLPDALYEWRGVERQEDVSRE